MKSELMTPLELVRIRLIIPTTQLLKIIPNICDCLGRGTANGLGWVAPPPSRGGWGGTVGLGVWVGLGWVDLGRVGLVCVQ